MKPYVWQEDMSEEDAKNGAYWERNMLALMFAIQRNMFCDDLGCEKDCGWYIHGEWEGWSRVISLCNGKFTFHVPDNFDLGDLPQIEPNWDGHTTLEKWENAMETCGIKDRL